MGIPLVDILSLRIVAEVASHCHSGWLSPSPGANHWHVTVEVLQQVPAGVEAQRYPGQTLQRLANNCGQIEIEPMHLNSCKVSRLDEKAIVAEYNNAYERGAEKTVKSAMTPAISRAVVPAQDLMQFCEARNLPMELQDARQKLWRRWRSSGWLGARMRLGQCMTFGPPSPHLGPT